MTIFFQGSEREAFFQGVNGVYTERTDPQYFEAVYSRAGVEFGGGAGFAFMDADAGVDLQVMWLHCVLRLGGSGGPNGHPLVTFMDAGGNEKVRLYFTSASRARLQYMVGAAWASAGPELIIDGAVALARYDIKVDCNTGVIELYKDQFLVHREEVSPTPATSLRKVRLHHAYGGNTTVFSQVVMADTSTINYGVKTAPPTANGTDTGGTGAVSAINEAVTNTSNYVELSNVGERRSFVSNDRGLTRSAKAVTVSGLLMVVDGTGPQKARPYLLISGIRYYGQTFTLASGFKNFQHTWNFNPANGNPWTIGQVNDPAMEFGWEAVA